jgi:hypothetical protein
LKDRSLSRAFHANRFGASVPEDNLEKDDISRKDAILEAGSMEEDLLARIGFDKAEPLDLIDPFHGPPIHGSPPERG